MTHAERLRDLAAHETLDAEHVEQEYPDDAALYRELAAACLEGAKALEIYPEDGFWSVEVRNGEIVAVIKLVQPREDGTR